MVDDGFWTEPPSGEDSDAYPDIEALLDLGYEQLDGFVAWLENSLDLGPRVAQQDCFNAELLIDYLANNHRKSATDINEYELRWFLFSHYIRKVTADADTLERVLVSLRNFYSFLQTDSDFVPPGWLWAVLDESAYYTQRRREYNELDEEDERAWEEGFTQWCAALDDDLDTRCLSLPRDLGHALTWADRMGWREATLWEEANQNWQLERAELLKEGLDFESTRIRLLNSYYTWVDMPQPKLEDRTPAETILEERQDAEEIEEDE